MIPLVAFILTLSLAANVYAWARWSRMRAVEDRKAADQAEYIDYLERKLRLSSTVVVRTERPS